MKKTAIVLLPVLLIFTACTQTIRPIPNQWLNTGGAPADSSTSYWWRYNIYLSWPQDQAPAWNMDLLLADQLFAPVLQAHDAELALWRFHRRAGKDAAGHRFALIFYCQPELAAQLYAEIDARLALLTSIGLQGIDRIDKTALENPAETEIASTSDKTWSVEIQRSWPYFINGVSKAWLHLIQEIAAPKLNDIDIADFDTLLAHRAQVESQVNADWRLQGGHAYIHHLNAIFGYIDVIITERTLMRF